MAGEEFLDCESASAFELERLDSQRIAATSDYEPGLISLKDFACGTLGGRLLRLPNL